MSETASPAPTTPASSPAASTCAAAPPSCPAATAASARRSPGGWRWPAPGSRSPAGAPPRPRRWPRACRRPATTRSAWPWTPTPPTRSAARSTRSPPASARLDLLVNCIGIQREERLADVSEAAFDEVVQVNLKAAMFLAQAAARHQVAAVAGGRAPGRQVHLLSVRAQLGMRDRGYSAYCATKGALAMLIKQHAVELSAHGITVNGVAPTVVRGEMGAHWLANPVTREHILARIPLGRVAEPEDVVGADPLLLQPGRVVRHRPDPLRRWRPHRHPVAPGCSDNLRQSLIERADRIRYVRRSARCSPYTVTETVMKRRQFASLGAALIGVAAVTGLPAMAQTKVVWKASDVHPLGYPTVEAIVRMGKKLETADQRPDLDPDVPVDAARRREGDDRAGAGRRAADRPHLGRRDGPGGRRPQRLQPAVHLPRRGAHEEGDRRPDRRRAAREDQHQPGLADRRPRLDGCRRAQRLRQEAGADAGRPQGPEDPDDGQPDLRRDDERDGRQRRGDGLQRALQRARDRRRRRRREQPADAAGAEPLSRQQGLHPHRPPHHPRDLHLLEAHLGRA